MTWSYSGIPSSTPLDQVRYLIGDTDVTDQQVRDEEIEWALTQFSNIYHVASLVLRSLQSRYARMVDCTVGSISMSHGKKAEALKSKADEMDRLAKLNISVGIRAFVGGISYDARETLREDEDGIPPRFTNGQFTIKGERRYEEEDCCG
jgi:hypothetical protein